MHKTGREETLWIILSSFGHDCDASKKNINHFTVSHVRMVSVLLFSEAIFSD